MSFKKILVAVDFTDNNDELLAIAKKYAKCGNAKVWLVHVAEDNTDFQSFEPSYQYTDFVAYETIPHETRDEKAEKLKQNHHLIQEYAQNLKKDGVDAVGLLIEGSTIKSIIEKSEKNEYDMIIIGHHKHGAFYSLLFSDSAAKLIKESSIPVLVVPMD